MKTAHKIVNKNRDQWQEFSVFFGRMFNTKKYLSFCNRFYGRWKFHAGGCFTIAQCLKKLIPNGEVWCIAEWEDDGNGSGDWSLQHYIFWLPTSPDMFLDSRGPCTQEAAICRIQGQHKNSRFQMAPVDSEWSGKGLWEGDHDCEDEIFDAIVHDAARLLNSK